MTKTFFADSGALMSPRTAKYVEALIREGDNFDYKKWLQKVREEEAEAKQILAASASGEPARIQIKTPISTSNFLDASPSVGRLMIKAVPVPRPIWRLHHEATSKGPKRWLEKGLVMRGTSFRPVALGTRVYGYLEAVFAIVEHYRTRRRTNKLLRHAFEFADQPLDKNADPFTAVIRCTCDGAVDNKTISKWARALRYVARYKEPETPLKSFMTEAGGVNACADQYARCFGRAAGDRRLIRVEGQILIPRPWEARPAAQDGLMRQSGRGETPRTGATCYNRRVGGSSPRGPTELLHRTAEISGGGAKCTVLAPSAGSTWSLDFSDSATTEVMAVGARPTRRRTRIVYRLRRWGHRHGRRA